MLTAVQQFMGVAWSLVAAFILSPSGSLFSLSHLFTVMDSFSVSICSKDLGQSSSRFMGMKIHGSDEKGCLTSVKTYVPAHFLWHTFDILRSFVISTMIHRNF